MARAVSEPGAILLIEKALMKCGLLMPQALLSAGPRYTERASRAMALSSNG